MVTRLQAVSRRPGQGVIAVPGGMRLAYRELVTGLRRLEVLAAEPPLTDPAAWRLGP